MSKNDGGSAFPSHGTMGEVAQEGMSLREWYAGQALSGLLSDSNMIDVSARAISSENRKDISVYELFSNMAYLYADAMLAERSKGVKDED